MWQEGNCTVRRSVTVRAPSSLHWSLNGRLGDRSSLSHHTTCVPHYTQLVIHSHSLPHTHTRTVMTSIHTFFTRSTQTKSVPRCRSCSQSFTDVHTNTACGLVPERFSNGLKKKSFGRRSFLLVHYHFFFFFKLCKM